MGKLTTIAQGPHRCYKVFVSPVIVSEWYRRAPGRPLRKDWTNSIDTSFPRVVFNNKEDENKEPFIVRGWRLSWGVEPRRINVLLERSIQFQQAHHVNQYWRGIRWVCLENRISIIRDFSEKNFQLASCTSKLGVLLCLYGRLMRLHE